MNVNFSPQNQDRSIHTRLIVGIYGKKIHPLIFWREGGGLEWIFWLEHVGSNLFPLFFHSLLRSNNICACYTHGITEREVKSDFFFFFFYVLEVKTCRRWGSSRYSQESRVWQTNWPPTFFELTVSLFPKWERLAWFWRLTELPECTYTHTHTQYIWSQRKIFFAKPFRMLALRHLDTNSLWYSVFLQELRNLPRRS